MNSGHLIIKDYLSTKFEASWATRSRAVSWSYQYGRPSWPLNLTFHWISIGIICSSRTIYLLSLKLLGQSVPDYQLHKVWETMMTFDLNINWDHLLIKNYLHTKIETPWAKCSSIISFTRLRYTGIQTDRPTCVKQYALPPSNGGLKLEASGAKRSGVLLITRLLRLVGRLNTRKPV